MLHHQVLHHTIYRAANLVSESYRQQCKSSGGNVREKLGTDDERNSNLKRKSLETELFFIVKLARLSKLKKKSLETELFYCEVGRVTE